MRGNEGGEHASKIQQQKTKNCLTVAVSGTERTEQQSWSQRRHRIKANYTRDDCGGNANREDESDCARDQKWGTQTLKNARK